MKNLLIYEFLHNKKNKDLYSYYDISLNSSYDIWDIFIEKVLYSHKRKLYIFKKTFEKITANNKEDHTINNNNTNHNTHRQIYNIKYII